MKKSFRTLLAATGIGLLALPFSGCKEDTILNADVVPVGDTINTLRLPDTVTILSKTYFDDSTRTDESYIFPALGTISTGADQWTGKTVGSIYLQLVPPTFNFSFPKDPDSVFFILPYAGFTYGDTTSGNVPQTFRLYQLDDTMSLDANYYSSSHKNVDRSKVLGEATVTFNSIKDSVYATGANRAPHLRVRVTDNDFIAKIRNSNANGNAPDFINYFKGLYIEPKDTNTGTALYYFRIDGTGEYSRANLLFYYTDKTSANEDTVRTASFYFNPTYNAYFNRVTRNYAGTPIANLLASTAPSDSMIVIQNEPGAVLDVVFPHIKHLPKTPINKAELVITQFHLPGDPNADKFAAPERIFPTGVNAEGGNYTILDRYPINSNEPLQFIDGTRKLIDLGGVKISQYTLNIPREVQRAIVEERDMLHLRISGVVQYPGAFRFVGVGRNSTDLQTRIKLNIVYSKF